MHRCKDNLFRCQYEDGKGFLCCAYVGRIVKLSNLCPVCGEVSVPFKGRTKDGRTIGACGDAFHL